MSRGLRFPRWAAQSERRKHKRQQHARGASTHNRRLVCEELEARRLLSVTLNTLVWFQNGALPVGGLIADATGNLYGTTVWGGTAGDGTVFEVAAGTHALSTLATFNGNNGEHPDAGLIADAAGNLYGTTFSGGTAGDGTVFEVAAGTHALSTLATFNGNNGGSPWAGLIADAAGNLYGTTFLGGAAGDGTVFEVAAGTHALTTLATFNGNNGSDPEAGLIADAAGNLYGTTEGGGTAGDGTVFEVAAGTHALSTLATFDGTNGSVPRAGLIADTAGNLYGTTWEGYPAGAGTVFEVAAGTHALTTLVAFNDIGAYPDAGLIADASGNLYGTTSEGGTADRGTVFEVAAGTHDLTALATFNGNNGQFPEAGLLADAAGNLYGTTEWGGTAGDGTVFEVAAGTHALTTLATFNGNNGAYPWAGLIADAAGNLYGATSEGGTADDGTVFEVAAGTHALSTLATFNGNNGEYPDGLIADAAGNLYGTTLEGGTAGDGTVFELAAGTHVLTTLATFKGNNGAGPDAGLIADTAGNLYGTTEAGATDDGGTVFEVAAGTDALTTLATFNGNNGDCPLAGLIADATGNLYGTTAWGGTAGDGTVFEVAAGTHALTTLATFNGNNGEHPDAGLIADAAGNLYGTTSKGGTAGVGTVFELTGSGFAVAPAPPTGLTTTALVNESELSWNPVPGANSYQVWRNTTNNQAAATEIASGIKSTTYDDATAIPGTTYYYWVVAAQGSQASTPSVPTTGVANAGSGTTPKLGELELDGNFSLGSGSTYAANGTVEIGFAPAGGQAFQPLLTVDGSVSYDNSNISVDGEVSADIGNLTLPVLSGSFQIPLGQAGETSTAPNTVNDTDPSGSEQIAGLPIQITGLALIPAGSGVPAPEIEVKGQISLLGTKLGAAFLITNQGLQLENGSVALPETSFSLGTLSVDATGMLLKYDATKDQFLAQGNLTLTDLFQGANATVDLTGDGNGITVDSQGVNYAGMISLNDLKLPNGWGLNDASLSINTLTKTYSGSADISIPGFGDIGGSITFLNGQLDDLSLSLTDMAEPIPIVDVPGLSLTGGSASIANLAWAATGPVTLSGTLDFSYGPDIEIDLPDWLGGNHLSCSIATLQIGASMSTGDLSGDATVTLADGLATATGKADLNLSAGTFTAKGSLDLADNAYTGSGKLTIGNGQVTVAATGTAQIPLHDLNSMFPNVPLASAGLYLDYQQSFAMAQDYLAVWGSVSMPTLFGSVTATSPAVRVGFDGGVSLRSAKDFPQVDPPASATFTVASGTPWALLGASWTNSSSNVPFEIQSPDGTIYTTSDLPGNIGVIDEADSSTQVTVGIQNPASGNWTLILTDALGLGTVSFQGVGGTAVSSAQIAFLQLPVNALSATAFNLPAVVAVEDQNGDVIATDNSQVTLTLTGGPGNTSTVMTAQAVNGIATFDGLAPQNAGAYTLQATDGTDTTAGGTFAVAPAPVSSLAFVEQPTNVVAGQTMAPAIVVQTQDPYGNVISGDTVTLAVEKYPSGTVCSTYLATTDSSGNATFANVSLPVAGTYTVVATDGAVSSGNSSSVTVSPGAASMLVFAQQPSNATAGTAISPNIVVDVEDLFGNLVTTDNSTVALSLNGDGSLNGALTVQAQNGVATFSGLSLNGSGIYTIGAGDGVLAATSSAFTISRAAPTVTLASPPPSIIYDGTGDVTNWAIPSVSGVLDMPNPTGLPNVVFYSGISSAGTPLASAPLNAGTYTAIATYSGDANYTAQSTPVTFTIKQATPTVTASDDHTTYTGLPLAYPSNDVTVSGANGLSKSGGSLSYTYNGSATVPAAAGNYTVVATFAPSDATDYTSASGDATWTINEAPAITSAASATFAVGNAGRFTVTTTGYPAAKITWSGKYPSWCKWVDNGDGTATMWGTPTATGAYTFTINATNSISSAAPQTFKLTVDKTPAITSAASTTFTVGKSGSFTIRTKPGLPATTTLSESGKLPSGVTLKAGSNGTATLSGKPAAGSGGRLQVHNHRQQRPVERDDAGVHAHGGPDARNYQRGRYNLHGRQCRQLHGHDQPRISDDDHAQRERQAAQRRHFREQPRRHGHPRRHARRAHRPQL